MPREDVRGAITSHRARATIATQLTRPRTRLIDQLADVATPAGLTPSELTQPTGTELPVLTASDSLRPPRNANARPYVGSSSDSDASSHA